MKPVFDYHIHAYVFFNDQYWHANEEKRKTNGLSVVKTDFSSVQKTIMKNTCMFKLIFFVCSRA